MFVPDEKLMKSLSNLYKSSSLVQKDVVVHGKHGTFTRKQLVRVGEDSKDKTHSITKEVNEYLKNGNATQTVDLARKLDTLPKGTVITTGEVSTDFVTGKTTPITITHSGNGYWKREPFGGLGKNPEKSSYNVIDKWLQPVSTKSKFKLTITTPKEDKNDTKKPDDKQTKQLDSSQSSLITFFQTKSSNPKQDVAKMLVNGHKREDIMAEAKKAGVTWKESDKEGINWMRASMAIQKHISSDTSQPAKAAQQPKATKAQPASSSVKSEINELSSKHSKDKVIEAAKSVGVSWNETNNKGINWMRCAMSLTKAIADDSSIKDKLKSALEGKSSKSDTSTSATSDVAKKAKQFLDEAIQKFKGYTKGAVDVRIGTGKKSYGGKGNVQQSGPVSAPKIELKPDKELEKELKTQALANGFTAVLFTTRSKTRSYTNVRGQIIKETTKERFAIFHKA